jgi:hypothetical protein
MSNVSADARPGDGPPTLTPEEREELNVLDQLMSRTGRFDNYEPTPAEAKRWRDLRLRADGPPPEAWEALDDLVEWATDLRAKSKDAASFWNEFVGPSEKGHPSDELFAELAGEMDVDESLEEARAVLRGRAALGEPPTRWEDAYADNVRATARSDLRWADIESAALAIVAVDDATGSAKRGRPDYVTCVPCDKIEALRAAVGESPAEEDT